MTEFTVEIAPEISAACRENAAEAAEAFGRAFEGECTFAPGDPTTLTPESPPEGSDGPGLLFAFKVGSTGGVIVVPEMNGLLPEWYATPDATQQSKLSTLAQELSMLLLPESLSAEGARAQKVEHVGKALERGHLGEPAALVPTTVTSAAGSVTLSLIWPLEDVGGLFGSASEDSSANRIEGAGGEAEQQESEPPGKVATGGSGHTEPAGSSGDGPIDESSESQVYTDQLPGYTRSLLKIEVPVTVRLATKKEPVGQILELCPGLILKFDKSCDEMLDLNVSGCNIATGEAVKVGDKFGLRIITMTLPTGRFRSVERSA